MKINNLLLLLVALFLSACNDVNAPIEADDFGYPKVIVKAAGQNVTGTQANELSEWVKSGYKYNGDTVVVMVYNDSGDYTSVWSSWFGANESSVASDMRTSSMCSIATPVAGDTNVKFTNPAQPPCIFSKGQGLYMLLTNPSSSVTDPNTYPNINRNPSSNLANFYTTGLWQNIAMYSQGSLAAGYLGALPNSATYLNGHAYFKILDKYYDDNSGGYFVALKRGFSPIVTPPLTYVINIVTSRLGLAAQNLFTAITKNTEYLLALKAVLILYMVISGLLYAVGLASMTQRELFYTVLRAIIVIQLLTAATSWNFFNNYLFSFFTSGLDEVLGIVTSTISGHVSGPFTFFDNLINLFFSRETWMKIISLCVSVPSGMVVSAMLALSFALLTIAVTQGLVLYLLAYMATCLLIILAPIFISFLLFKQTKSLFEGWLNQFAHYFFQPVLVFASLALLSQLIINQVYKILGFGVCYQNYITFPMNGRDFVFMKAWQICSFSKNSAQANIAVPGYGFWDTADPTRFCAPFECIANRYIALPFLDPVKDASLINAFENPFISLNLPMLYNGFILVLLSYLMFKFNEVIPDLGKGISGGGGGSLGVAAHSSTGDMKKFASGVQKAAQSTAAYQALQKGFEKFKSKVIPTKLRSFINSKNQMISDEEFGGMTKGVKEAMKKNSAFRALGFLARIAIPPLSMSMRNKEEEQKKAWQKQSTSSKQGESESDNDYQKRMQRLKDNPELAASKLGYGLKQTKEALIGAVQDKFIDAPSALGRGIANLGRRAVGMEIQKAPEDSRKLGVSDVLKAASRYAIGQISYRKDIDKPTIDAELKRAGDEVEAKRQRERKIKEPAINEASAAKARALKEMRDRISKKRAEGIELSAAEKIQLAADEKEARAKAAKAKAEAEAAKERARAEAEAAARAKAEEAAARVRAMAEENEAKAKAEAAKADGIKVKDKTTVAEVLTDINEAKAKSKEIQTGDNRPLTTADVLSEHGTKMDRDEARSVSDYEKLNTILKEGKDDEYFKTRFKQTLAGNPEAIVSLIKNDKIDPENMKMVIELISDVNIKVEGKSLLEIATDNGRDDIKAMLEARGAKGNTKDDT